MPKANGSITGLFQLAPALSLQDRQGIADAMNQLADKARDLDEIADRLLNEEHTPPEIGELLIAFELTKEQLRGHEATNSRPSRRTGLTSFREALDGHWV